MRGLCSTPVQHTVSSYLLMNIWEISVDSVYQQNCSSHGISSWERREPANVLLYVTLLYCNILPCVAPSTFVYASSVVVWTISKKGNGLQTPIPYKFYA